MSNAVEQHGTRGRDVVVATDFSRASEMAIRVAAREARLLDGQLVVLHVVRSAADGPSAANQLRNLVQQMGLADASTVVCVGDAADEIGRFAGDNAAAVVVAGRHGRTGFTRALLGSVAEQLARTSAVPVLLVPDSLAEVAPAVVEGQHRCVACGAVSEALLCEPCRFRVRLQGPPADVLARAAIAGALTDEQMDHVLGSTLLGRLACHDGPDLYVVPIAYLFDAGRIFFQSGEGKKLTLLRANPNVCFQVDRIVDLANWQSVIVWGTYAEVGPDEAPNVRRRLFGRLASAPGDDELRPAPSTVIRDDRAGHRAVAGGRGAVVGCIDVTRRTGRFERR